MACLINCINEHLREKHQDLEVSIDVCDVHFRIMISPPLGANICERIHILFSEDIIAYKLVVDRYKTESCGLIKLVELISTSIIDLRDPNSFNELDKIIEEWYVTP